MVATKRPSELATLATITDDDLSIIVNDPLGVNVERVATYSTVRDYAASAKVIIGDGVTDNTTAIRAAIAALPARTAKARVSLIGQIILSGIITIPDYTIIDIQGKVTLANNSNCNLFRIGDGATAGKFIEISGGGEINGNRANQSAGVGITVYPGQDVLITGIYIHDCCEQNIRVLGNSTRVTVRGVKGVDGGAGNVYFLQATVGGTQPEITDSSIEDCTLYYTTSIANVANVGLENCRQVKVINNHISGPADFGVHVEEHIYDSTIANNIITGSTQDGIRVGYSERNLITANISNQNGYRGISLSQGANQNTISMNSVQENGRSGILLEDCRDNLILDNNAINNNQTSHATYNAGIQILSLGAYAPTGNTVKNNIARDNQTPKTQKYGISEGGLLADLNIFENNDVQGNLTDGIQQAVWGQNNSRYRNNIGGFNQLTFTAGDTTPSVAIDIGLFRVANASPTIITMFDDGYYGQEMTVVFDNANTTIDFTGTNLKGNGLVDWTPAAFSSMRCKFDGTYWYCVKS